ncbi:RNA polymerase III RPC4 [Euphorbia peplus]|nr:RNA polymerase III RPC4 [Euphorbia peplus]
MDQDRQNPSPAGRRTPKFKPKDPPRRKPKVEVHDAAKNSEEEAALARKLMGKFNENHTRKVPKVEKKSAVQATFGEASSSVSTSLRKYGVPDRDKNAASSRTGMNDSTKDEAEIAKIDGSIQYISDKLDALPRKIKRDYRESWDYNHTYYPTTLPWRRPYSGDPEFLNEAEFGEAARKSVYDEKTINAASDLGLLEESDKERLFLFKLPPKLPLVKRSASVKGKEKAESSHGKTSLKKRDTLEDLSEGCMGKMVVYRSGAIKLKLGDTLYDVSPGSDCTFAQNVMVIDKAAKACGATGELQKHAVVTPDVDSLLNSTINLS